MTRSPLRALVAPALASAVGAALLIGLGLWQLQRLAWKEALISAAEQRAHAAPVDLPPPEQWASLDPGAYEYRHVRVSGVYDGAHQALVFRAMERAHGRFAGQGYLAMTPLRLASGAIVLINRGFVPQDRQDAAAVPPDGARVEITGLMRASEPRNFFTPADNPARGQWFTRDVAAITTAFGLKDAAPFFIDADAGAPDQLPEGGETILAFPNHHFEYALTWFGMALALAGVFAAFAATQLRKSAAAAPAGGR